MCKIKRQEATDTSCDRGNSEHLFGKKFNQKGGEALAWVFQRLGNPCPWQSLLRAEQSAEQLDLTLILALL